MKRADIQSTFRGITMNYDNMIVIENMEDLYEYLETIHTDRCKKIATDIIEKKPLVHYETTMGDFCNTIQEITGRGSLLVLSDILGKVSTNQIMHVIKGERLAINPNGGYFTIPEDSKINFLTDFKYTEKDINITMYENGRHYYSTIGGIDVIDEFGDHKWNTYQTAEKYSKIFLQQLNNKK